MRKIAILGSTGSIGTQTLDIIRDNTESLKVVSLVAYSNAAKLSEQVSEFKPEYYALISVGGDECLIKAVQNCDLAVVATRGICAIESILYCLNRNIDVAIANKEALVCAGEIIFDALSKSSAKLIPIDSEHYAISQCLLNNRLDVNKILLTASGGPFWNFSKKELSNVTPEQALKHPNWNMGSKITIDSATMMNKALEVIEASYLFGVNSDAIQIVVHRQSIVHSMVEFSDGSIIAQLANPDMRLPIQSALLDKPCKAYAGGVNMSDMLTLTFEKCNFENFPCAKLGYEIKQYPPLCATVMNAANDVCVEKFLKSQLSFNDFYNIIIRIVNYFAKEVSGKSLDIDSIKIYDSCARKYAEKIIDGELC